MKLRVTMDIEIGDLTDRQRAELEDDLNFVSREKFGTKAFPADEDAEGFVPTVPLLAEQDFADVTGAVREAMAGIDEWQDEMWAGSDVYARITGIHAVNVAVLEA